MIQTNEIEIHVNNPTKIKANGKFVPETPCNSSKTQNGESIVITTSNDTPILKTPVNIDDIDYNTATISHLTQRTIEVATTVVIVNNRVTTVVTL